VVPTGGVGVSCSSARSETELLAVRHALPVVDRDDGQTWHESFGLGAWLAGGQGRTGQARARRSRRRLRACVTAHREWHIADVVIEDDNPLPLRYVRAGQPVSIDARSVKRTDNDDLRIRRHRLVQRQSIAILGSGELPVYTDAKIARIRELAVRAHELEGEVITTNGTLRREGIGQVPAIR
jgi:hypothetical protein